MFGTVPICVNINEVIGVHHHCHLFLISNEPIRWNLSDVAVTSLEAVVVGSSSPSSTVTFPEGNTAFEETMLLLSDELHYDDPLDAVRAMVGRVSLNRGVLGNSVTDTIEID